MTTKKKLIWRLGKLPSVEELRQLVTDKIITHEEAREILFSSETEEDREKSSLESEIKFLRELVEKLSNDRSRIINVIETIKVPYIRSPWFNLYKDWCDCGTVTYELGDQTIAIGSSSSATCSSNFSNIKTF